MYRPADVEPETPTLFEAWMGMTAQEWDELGGADAEDEPRLL